ncbi:hypothetical protein IID62_11260 [candidate division KSB1 bacterium]|nr:hypothetical protein [candidate division KSB1 bacterium]
MSSHIYGIDQYGMEMKRCDYILSDDGKELANELITDNKRAFKKIKEFSDSIKENGDPDYKKLSLAAKALFVLRNEGKKGITTSEIAKKARSFNWKVEKEDIDNAADLLKKLKFVK